MAILLDEKSRVVVQGITGSEGSFHTRESVKLGTRVVAGVTPGKGGTALDGIPVYDRVGDAVERQQANVSGIYTPAVFTPDAIFEAIEAGIGLVVCMTEGVPVAEMIKVKQALKGSGARLIGPNCPGITPPGTGKVGFMPNFIHKQGNVGVVSRSGTLTYEMIWQLTGFGIGQSTSVGIGGDPIVGCGFIDILGWFEADPSADRGDCDDRRDRRDGGRRGCRVHPGPGNQAGGLVYRRTDCPSRTADGPCGCNHLGKKRNRRREVQGYGAGRCCRRKESRRDRSTHTGDLEGKKIGWSPLRCPNQGQHPHCSRNRISGRAPLPAAHRSAFRHGTR